MVLHQIGFFFRIHDGDTYSGVTYCTVNPYDKSRNIYYICDPPHLLKTARNNLENSHGNKNSRSLYKDGHSIKWPHIVSTVREDKELPLTKLKNIREEHINLSPQLRMRVRLAAQILSTSMAVAIRQRHLPDMEQTSIFCEKLDFWFDCLNGRYPGEGERKRKPAMAPYYRRLQPDPRFGMLENDFLGWLNTWEDQVQQMPNLSQAEKNRLFISHQTAEGLRITTISFIQLVQVVLADGAEYVLGEKVNQDKLEMFFAKLRRSVGDSDNPSVSEVGQRFLALLIAGSQTVNPRNANCQIDYNEPQTWQLRRQKRV